VGWVYASLRFVVSLLLFFCAKLVTSLMLMGGGNPAITPIPGVRPWWVARHQAKVEEAKAGHIDLLFVGESITQNYEKTGPAPDHVFAPSGKSSSPRTTR
jgi:hypothetical protein